MPPRNAPALLERALSLPTAKPTDFVATPPPPEAHPDHLKVVADTALRARLIQAGVAQGLQSPKGTQKIPSIIRIYPAFDAARAKVVAGKRPGKPARKGQELPTVEEFEALLKRIRAIEGHVARELSMSIDGEIAQAQRRVAEAFVGEVDAAFHDLGALLEKRRDARRFVRAAAFDRIEADKEFPLRGFLRLLAREIGPEGEAGCAP